MAEPSEELGNTPEAAGPSISKNALKRQIKRQRWEDSKADRRAYKRAKLKEKREIMKQSGQRLPKKGRPVVEGQENSGIRVVIDCSFDDLMIDKEIYSMSSQLTRCHADNRRSRRPVEIYLTGLDKRLGERMETAMKGVHHRWQGVHASAADYESVLTDVQHMDLVYLTADSPNVIHSLEKDKVYIIGGLIDRNRHKGVCYNKAVKQGIQHGRLPIGDYIKMASRHVLTINQVLEIMLRWLETRDWEKAFMHVIPKRKLPEAQQRKGIGSANDNRNEDQEGQDASDHEDEDSSDPVDVTEIDLLGTGGQLVSAQNEVIAKVEI